MSAVLDQLPGYTAGQRRLTYAGVGSRQTPEEVLAMMSRVARRLAELGYTLRSGGALGADSAFERGAGPRKEIFVAADARGHALALQLVGELHPNPRALGEYPRLLMARNAFQVFGRQLNDPVDFVLCYTPDGCESHATRTRASGGTGQAISLADLKGIPVINLANPGWKERIQHLVTR